MNVAEIARHCSSVPRSTGRPRPWRHSSIHLRTTRDRRWRRRRPGLRSPLPANSLACLQSCPLHPPPPRRAAPGSAPSPRSALRRWWSALCRETAAMSLHPAPGSPSKPCEGRAATASGCPTKARRAPSPHPAGHRGRRTYRRREAAGRTIGPLLRRTAPAPGAGRPARAPPRTPAPRRRARCASPPRAGPRRACLPIPAAPGPPRRRPAPACGPCPRRFTGSGSRFVAGSGE